MIPCDPVELFVATQLPFLMVAIDTWLDVEMQLVPVCVYPRGHAIAEILTFAPGAATTTTPVVSLHCSAVGSGAMK